MKLVDLKTNEFVNEVASKSPAPGGGSVAALAGSLSSALAHMVTGLTIGKKKFKAKEETTQNFVLNAVSELEEVKEAFLTLIDKDTEAFNLIMGAFKLPKETDEEKALRRTKIEEATIAAVEVPKEVAYTGKRVLPALLALKEHGNQNCLSDLGVSGLLLHTTITGAVMNMQINLPGISDKTLKAAYQKDIDELTAFSNEHVLPFTKEIQNKL